MGKTLVFIVVYSLFLIALFCIFLYLLSTVKPRIPSQSKSEEDELFSNLFSTRKRRSKFQAATENLLEHDKKFSNETKKNINTMLPSSSYDTQLSKGNTTSIYGVKELNDDVRRIIPESYLDNFRKSVNDVQLQPNSNQSVIFKILDNDGYSRVEIRINNKKRKKSRKLRDNSRQRQPQVGKDLQKYDTKIQELSNLPKNSVLILMPNNTLVYAVEEPLTDNEIVAEENITLFKEYLRGNQILLTTTGSEIAESSELVSEITINESLDVTTRSNNVTTLTDVSTIAEYDRILADDTLIPSKDAMITAQVTLMPVYDAKTSAEDISMPTEDAMITADDNWIPTENEMTTAEDNLIVRDDVKMKAEDTVMPAEDAMITAEDTITPTEDARLAKDAQTVVRDNKSLNKTDLVELANEILLDNSISKVETNNFTNDANLNDQNKVARFITNVTRRMIEFLT